MDWGCNLVIPLQSWNLNITKLCPYRLPFTLLCPVHLPCGVTIYYTTCCRYLQHGTYPLVNPFDEVLPDNYYIERTDMVNFDVPTNNVSIIYKNTWPRQGAWFAVIYLNDRNPEDDRIRLKTMVPLHVKLLVSRVTI